jgi:hypothetical protein
MMTNQEGRGMKALTVYIINPSTYNSAHHRKMASIQIMREIHLDHKDLQTIDCCVFRYFRHNENNSHKNVHSIHFKILC